MIKVKRLETGICVANNENQADKDCYIVHHCHNSHMYHTYEFENEVTSQDIFRSHGKVGQVETSYSFGEFKKTSELTKMEVLFHH